MSLTCSGSPYKCSRCCYTTTRKFNYERHINLVHDLSICSEDTNVVDKDTNVVDEDTNVVVKGANVVVKDAKVVVFKCPNCYKHYSSQKNLKKHTPRCNGKEHPYQCTECKKLYASRTTLAHHKKICKGMPLILQEKYIKPINHTINHIDKVNITNIINNNTVNINILPCPLTREESFDFNCENITHTVLKHILQNTSDSSIRFNRFIGKVLENPQNQVIRKTNPKDNHSLIHLGNGKWELAYDKDTLPILTHHMTTAALGKIIEIEEQASFLIESIKGFRNQVTIINQMDYNEDEYKNTIQRIKLKIVNITQELLREEKLLKNEI